MGGSGGRGSGGGAGVVGVQNYHTRFCYIIRIL